MCSVFKDNIESLKERFPILADELTNVAPCEDRRMAVSRNGHTTYEYCTNGKWKALTSLYDPRTEADRQVEELDIKDSKLVFVLGEAGFYHVEALLRAAPSTGKVVLVSNSLSVLRFLLESRDLSETLRDSRFVILASDQYEMLHAMATSLVMADWYDIPTFSLFIHPVESQMQSDFVAEFQKTLRQIYSMSLATFSTTQFFEQWWSHNFLENVYYLLTGAPVLAFKDVWKSRPVIIVGAGPSLSKNIHLLQSAKGKALIFCVDTAYRILEKHGIEPDLVVTLDGSPMNAKHMEGCDYSNIPLFMDEYADRTVAARHEGPKIINTGGMYHRHWWTDIYGGDWTPSSIPTGGSVATTAFSFARLIDADPVILIGVDLSYPNGRLYAQGALNSTGTVDDQKAKREFLEIRDIHGEPILTTRDYLFYLRWFETEAARADRTYINATEGGALKEGFDIMSLRDVLETYCQKDQSTDEWARAIQNEKLSRERYTEVLNRLKRSRRELKLASKLLGSLGDELEAHLGQLGEERDDGVVEVSPRARKLQSMLNRLPLAMAFLDAHSYKTIYKDIKLTEWQEQERDKYSESEYAMRATDQALTLVRELAQITGVSIEMHDDGIRKFTQLYQREVVQV